MENANEKERPVEGKPLLVQGKEGKKEKGSKRKKGMWKSDSENNSFRLLLRLFPSIPPSFFHPFTAFFFHSCLAGTAFIHIPLSFPSLWAIFYSFSFSLALWAAHSAVKKENMEEKSPRDKEKRSRSRRFQL